MKQRGHQFSFWDMGHFLALMLLLLAILIIAPGAAQQTGDTASVVPPVVADSPLEAQNSDEQGFAPQATISPSAKGASSPHEAKTPTDLNWERVKREFAHQLDLVKKDIENIKEMFSGTERGIMRIEIYIAIVALVITSIGLVVGGLSIYAMIGTIKGAEKKVDEFLKHKGPEIRRLVGEIGREAAQNFLKWAQEEKRTEEKRTEEKTKRLEGESGHPDAQASPAIQIHNAAYLGDTNDIERLVKEKGVSIDERDDDGDTPLLSAMLGNNPQATVEKIIELDANVKVKSAHGFTPLHIAVMRNLVPVLSLLKNKGADINAKDNDGDTPLLIAMFAALHESAEELIKCGADVKAANKKKYTPMHVAVARGMVSTISLLVDKGADINARDEDGDTPLDVAAGLGKYAIADDLQKRGGKRGSDL